MPKVKIIRIGIVLPKKALQRLNVAKVNTLYLVERPDGLTLTPYEQGFDEQMRAAEQVMKRYRNALRRLAK